jgi:hypothetical protein
MSESNTEQTTTEAQEQKQGDPADAPLGEGGKKALEAEREARKAAERERDDFKRKVDEAARANETAIEKAQREATEAREAAAQAPVLAFREAAVKFGGISREDAELFLTGSNVETLEKQAARLMDRTTNPPAGPRPDLSQGGSGGKATGSTADQFAAAFDGLMNR